MSWPHVDEITDRDQRLVRSAKWLAQRIERARPISEPEIYEIVNAEGIEVEEVRAMSPAEQMALLELVRRWKM